MTPDYSSRISIGQQSNRLAKQKALDQIALTGWALPCHVVEVVSAGIVVVAFNVQAISGNVPITMPPVTVPVLGSQWLRAPIQVGTLGFTVPADVFLGGVSGLGDGVAAMTRTFNLDSLVFSPIGNTAWPTKIGPYTLDPNMVNVYGPDGVFLSDTAGKNAVSIASNGAVSIVAQNSFTVTVGGTVFTMTPSGITMTTTTDSVTIDGTVFETHEHPGVQTGIGQTEGPVNP